jgi:hypothetical protein
MCGYVSLLRATLFNPNHVFNANPGEVDLRVDAKGADAADFDAGIRTPATAGP